MAIAGSPVQAQRRIRLSIFHLLMWTCGVAAGVRAYQALAPELQEWVSPLGQVYTCVMGIASGTFVFGSAAIAFHWHRGQHEYPYFPGDWLLLLGFAAVLANTVAIGVVLAKLSFMSGPTWATPTFYWAQFLTRWDPNGLSLTHQTIGWGMGAVIALVFFLWYLRGRVSTSWGYVLFLFFLSSASLFGGYLLALFRHRFIVDDPQVDVLLYAFYRIWCMRAGHLYVMSVIICAVAILMAVVQDARRHMPSDWLHWEGICAWLAIATIQIATFTVLTMHN